MLEAEIPGNATKVIIMLSEFTEAHPRVCQVSIDWDAAACMTVCITWNLMDLAWSDSLPTNIKILPPKDRFKAISDFYS